MLSYDAYRKELTSIRHRGGVINAYASRLHYFTDWASDNEKKGILLDRTKELGGLPYRKKVYFMSDHRHLYLEFSDSAVYKNNGADRKTSFT